MEAGNFTVASAVVRGIEAIPVSVELAVSAGIPGMSIVGSPDSQVLEARSRVRSSLKSCGFTMPRMRLTVNLAPADVRKSGTGFDLPLAVAILASTGQIPSAGLEGCLFVGELGLSGSVRSVRGIVAYERLARQMGMTLVTGPGPDLLPGEDVAAVSCMTDLLEGVGRIRERNSGPVLGTGTRTLPTGQESKGEPSCTDLDYADVLDQEAAKRALVISAAGDHGILMVGPPGSGKSMLAKRLPTILPPLTENERNEALLVNSVAGQDLSGIAQGMRPFRAPHHSVSLAGMIGGGRPVVPGEVSLAHEGVLFLDELPEFASNVLQALRQPFEEHEVRLVRADGLYRFPCRFTFVAASNPCPCGYLGDPAHECTCTPARVQQYQSRIGGPFSDRIDMHVFVSRPDSSKVVCGVAGLDSAAMREQVMAGREFASWREARDGSPRTDGLEHLGLEDRAARMLASMAARLGFGGRAIVRVARVARTIADIDQRESVMTQDVLEACAYRDRREG